MSPLEKDLKEGQKWEFDESVAQNFDDMLERSIPQYEMMRDLVTKTASRFARKHTTVVDLGCSRGEALARVALATENVPLFYLGVEVSEPMRKAAEDRFEGYPAAILDTDLRHAFPPVSPPPSVVMSVLTLQFIPIEYRQRVVRRAYESLSDGGAFILVEKVLGETADIDEFFVDTYLDLKKDHGYDQEEIDRKKMSLEGVLVPVTASWNVELLKQAGFREIDCFWRWGNFAGWIGLKT